MAGLLSGCQKPGPRELLDGERLIREGKYGEAVGKLQIAVKYLPQNAQAWNHLGLACQYDGKAGDALAAYQKAVSLDRNLPAVRFNLGNLHLEQGRLGEAISELRTTTVLEPNSVPAWDLLGKAQLRSRMVDDAEKSFGMVLRMEPNNVEALNYEGVVQLHRRKAREAYGYFASALKQQPDYAPAVLNEAIVYHHYIVNRTNALAKYREYLGMKPDPAGAQAANEAVRAIEAELQPKTIAATTNAPAMLVTNRVATVATNRPATNRLIGTVVTNRLAVAATNVAGNTAHAASIATNVTHPAATNLARPVPVPVSLPANVARTNAIASSPIVAPTTNTLPKVEAAETGATKLSANPVTNIPPSKPVAIVTTQPPTPAPKTNEVLVAEIPKKAIETPKPELPKPDAPKTVVTNAPAVVTTKPTTAPIAEKIVVAEKPVEKPIEKPAEKPVASAPLEVVKLDDDTVIRPAPVKDVAPPKSETKPEPRPTPLPPQTPAKPAETIAKVEPTPNAAPPASPVQNSAAAALKEEPPPLVRPIQREEKPSLLKRANPLNWFKRDKDKEEPEVKIAARPAVTSTSVAAKPTADLQALPEPPPEPKPEVKPEPVIPRYPYQTQALPVAGDRKAAEPRFNEAVQAHQDGKIGTAMDGYRAAIRIDPRFFEAHLNLGIAAMQANDLSLALASLEDSVRLNEKSVDARYQFALALRKANYPLDAVNELKTLLEQAPDEARAHLTLANLYAQVLNKPEEAAAHYQKFLKLAPQHPQADQVRGWLAAHG